MHSRWVLVGLIGQAASFNRMICQQKTEDPLQGCPSGTLFVSQRHSSAKYHRVQDAIKSIKPSSDLQIILIDSGTYLEQVNVTIDNPVTLLGVTSASEDVTKNTVIISWKSANLNDSLHDNADTSTLTVAPNYVASLVGTGPTGYPIPENTPCGSVDFRIYNINVTNEAAPYSNGPSHAIAISRANASFYYSSFQSFQDTVYVGKIGNAYWHRSVIGGQTDFIYGFGTAYIESSTIMLRSCGGGIVAWKGSNTTFENQYGVYISGSKIRAENSSIASDKKRKCALGRPWNSLHRSVYMDTDLDETILPEGYVDWPGHPITQQTILGEWKSSGPGFNLTARRLGKITTLLTDTQVKKYLKPEDVFRSPEGLPTVLDWIDSSYV